MSADSHNDNGSNKVEDIEKALREWESNVKLDLLSDVDRKIHKTHLEAVKKGKEIYEDPVTGFHVFTIRSHLERGNCCGNACRHCPYEHANVSGRYKKLKNFNSAFYN